MRILTIVACIAAAPFLSAASQPVRLQPSSPWVLDYAENSCRLIREFGDGDTKTKFALESEAPGKMDMLIVGKPLKSNADELGAKFLPIQHEPITGYAAHSDDGNPAALWSTVVLPPNEAAELAKKRITRGGAELPKRPAPIDMAEKAQKQAERQAFVGQIRELEIDSRRSRLVLLELGSLVAPIQMLDKCSRDSLRDWGIDPDVDDKIVRRVWAPAPWKWFNPDDYPRRALLHGDQSIVKVRLLVDATGRVTKCTGISHFKAPEFDQLACATFLKFAQFEPAELADGTKVPSYFVTRVEYRVQR